MLTRSEKCRGVAHSSDAVRGGVARVNTLPIEIALNIFDDALLYCEPPVVAVALGKRFYHDVYTTVWLHSARRVAEYIKQHHQWCILGMLTDLECLVRTLMLIDNPVSSKLLDAIKCNNFATFVTLLRPRGELRRYPILRHLFVEMCLKNKPARMFEYERALSLGYDCFEVNAEIDAHILGDLQAHPCRFDSSEICNIMRVASRKHDDAMLDWMLSEVIGKISKYSGIQIPYCHAAILGNLQREHEKNSQWVLDRIKSYGYTTGMLKPSGFTGKQYEKFLTDARCVSRVMYVAEWCKNQFVV